MNTNGIWARIGIASVVGDQAIQIVNGTQTIAPQLEVVGHDPSTYVTKVESGLAMEGRAWVCVRYVHIRQCKPVEQTPIVVTNLLRVSNRSMMVPCGKSLHRREPFPPSG